MKGIVRMNKIWRIILAFIGISAVFFGCSSKEHDIIVAEVGKNPVKLGEYEKFFSRNSGGWDVAKSSKLSERERFLDLLTDYRLKLLDAYDRNLQNDPELKAELVEYRSSLAATFLIDKEITEPGIRQLYDRRQVELRASHILISLRQEASPDDTAKAYARAMEIIRRAKAGEPFDSLAKNLSEDPTAKSNLGDIYYFTSGQMTPMFENAAYAMKVGEISPSPVRTPFGYHIIKLTDRQPARGSMKVRHIMTRFPSPADSDTVAVYRRMVALQDSLRKGANFILLAKKSSEDAGSAAQGGDLGWFERRRWVQSFDDAAFRLHPGEVSPIVRTPYGYHIILCDSTKPIPSYDDMKEELKKTFMQYRYNDEFAAYTATMRQQYKYWFNDSLFNAVAAEVDTDKTVEDSDWVVRITPEQKRNALYRVNGKSISLDSAINILNRRPEYKNTSMRRSELKSRFDRIGDSFLFDEHAIGLERRSPEFAAMMGEYQDGIVLFKAEQLEVWNKVAVNDSALHAYWQENKGKFMTTPRVKYQEIRVPYDTLALLLYDSLSRGVDFGVLADRHNSDPDLLKNHGICDSVLVDTETVSRLADSIGVGEVSDPVINENATWSVIKTLAKEKAREKTFDEAGAEVSNALQEAESKRLEVAWLERLKLKYPVKQYKEYLPRAFSDSAKAEETKSSQ